MFHVYCYSCAVHKEDRRDSKREMDFGSRRWEKECYFEGQIGVVEGQRYGMFCFDKGNFCAEEGGEVVCSRDCFEDLLSEIFWYRSTDWGSPVRVDDTVA